MSLDRSIIAVSSTHKSLRVFDLPFTNFHIDKDFNIVLYANIVKLIALNFCD